MDFFERQDKARRKTKLLVFYFIVAICLLILSGYAAVLAIFGRDGVSDSMGESSFTLWQPDLFLWSTLGTLSVDSDWQRLQDAPTVQRRQRGRADVGWTPDQFECDRGR